MSSYTVTTSTTKAQVSPTSVPPGKTAHGTGTFCVTNISGSILRTRLRVQAANPAHSGWAKIRGDEEINIAPGVTTNIDIDLDLPGTATPGPAVFTLTAINVNDPDNDYEASPAIEVQQPTLLAGTRSFTWLYIALAALLLIGGLGVGVYFLMQPNTNTAQEEPATPPELVDVPDLTGKTIAEGFKMLVDEGLATKDTKPGDTGGPIVIANKNISTANIPPAQRAFYDQIIKEQQPEAGPVERGSTVEFSWMYVRKPFVIPNLNGQTLVQATQSLKEQGLLTAINGEPPLLKIIEKEDTNGSNWRTVPERFYEKVISRQDDPVSQADGTKSVTIYFQYKPKMVQVPDVIGASYARAKALIKDAGLRPVLPTDPDPIGRARIDGYHPKGNVPAGTVIWMD